MEAVVEQPLGEVHGGDVELARLALERHDELVARGAARIRNVEARGPEARHEVVGIERRVLAHALHAFPSQEPHVDIGAQQHPGVSHEGRQPPDRLRQVRLRQPAVALALAADQRNRQERHEARPHPDRAGTGTAAAMWGGEGLVQVHVDDVKVRPGDMGFDVIHMNLHKTFSTPHGGGGPGAGAVGVGARLVPFLPVPLVGRERERYRWLTEADLPQSIGRLSAFMGNTGVLLRAYIYMRLLGREGMQSVGEYATLNANYLMARLRAAGFDVPYPRRPAGHEFIVTLKRQARELNVTAMDFAKRLLDYGFHAPTT